MAFYSSVCNGDVTMIGAAVNRRYYRYVQHLLAPKLHNGTEVLELGTGRGEIADLLTRAGCSYLGMDRAPNCSVDHRHTVLRCRVPPIHRPDSSCDIVVASAILEHTTGQDEVWALLREIWRVLRPGGWCFLMVPVYDDNPGLFWSGDYTHQYPTQPYRMAILLRDAGFRVVRQTMMRGGVTGYLGKVLWGPFAVAVRLLGYLLPDCITYSRAWTKMQMTYSADHILVAERVLL